MTVLDNDEDKRHTNVTWKEGSGFEAPVALKASMSCRSDSHPRVRFVALTIKDFNRFK